MKFVPRGSWVIVKRVHIGKTPGGVVLPDACIDGVQHKVFEIGPKAAEKGDLKVGDTVLIAGTIGKDYGPLPNRPELFIMHEENVVMKYEAEDGDVAPEVNGEAKKAEIFPRPVVEPKG